MNPPANPDPGPAPPRSALGAIEGRRTARRFDPDRPLPDDVLGELLRLATLAPSSFNLQPWRFVVVRDPRNRRKLRGCTFGEARLTDAPVALIVLGYLHPHETDLAAVVARQVELGALTPDQAARVRAEAPRVRERSPDPALDATRPALLAAASLLIAAEAVGVASTLIEEFDREGVRRGFGVPDDHEVCCLIALGFAAEASPFPGRFGLDHACFREHFGQPWDPAEGGPGPALDRGGPGE